MHQRGEPTEAGATHFQLFKMVKTTCLHQPSSAPLTLKEKLDEILTNFWSHLQRRASEYQQQHTILETQTQPSQRHPRHPQQLILALCLGRAKWHRKRLNSCRVAQAKHNSPTQRLKHWTFLKLSRESGVLERPWRPKLSIPPNLIVTLPRPSHRVLCQGTVWLYLHSVEPLSGIH
ncbi:Hypothetical predicted protein [Pelobates cultripes]|uniref:Uncharacterized protein n=1 Tax=Pelobates cultripes TaxID=61616 RepID=A0AAD1S956_PELCU|nr:Hypothetical predicted protein [Pelobates cultripes]